MRRPIRIFFYVLFGLLVLGALPTFILSCSKCSLLPDVNVTANGTTGNIEIDVRGIPFPASGSPTEYKNIVFDGRLLNGTGNGGLSTFHITKDFEITTNSINPQPTITEPGLKTGNWEVKVTSDAWSATATGQVNKDGTRSFTYTYNSQNVAVN